VQCELYSQTNSILGQRSSSSNNSSINNTATVKPHNDPNTLTTLLR